MEEVVQSVKERFLMERDSVEIQDVTGSVPTLRERIDEHLASYFDCLSMKTDASLVRMTAPFEGRVLEVGCGIGDLLAAVKPSRGVGVDISPEMVKLASNKYDLNLGANSVPPRRDYFWPGPRRRK